MSGLAELEMPQQKPASDVEPTASMGEHYALPISLSQERFLLLDQRDRGDPKWNVAVRFKVAGGIDASRLRQSLSKVVDRHEILRTNFSRDGESWVQSIKPVVCVELRRFDLREHEAPDRLDEIERISQEEAQHRFDLESGPLFRFALLTMGDADHLFLATFHQAIVDLWSIGVIMRDLSAFYSGVGAGPELPVQFGDYAAWERDQTTAGAYLADLEFWRQQLADLPILKLPSDFEAPAEPHGEGRIAGHLLPIEQTDRLQDLAHSEGTSFYNVMLAAACVVLHKYCHQSRFGMGTQLPGRPFAELENLVGPFVNTMVLRIDIDGHLTFTEFLTRVHDVAAQAMEHATIRWEEVLRSVRPQEFPHHHGLYRVNFVCQRMVRAQQFEGISFTSYPAKSPGAMYELSLFLIQRKEGWRLGCEYRPDLFSEETINTFLHNYRELLSQITASPTARIDEFRCDFPERKAPAQPSSQSSAESAFVLPASVTQRRYWAVEQLAPGNPAVNMRAAVRITGPLSEPALRQSLNYLLERHEVLRTTFKDEQGDLFQVISGKGELPFEVTDSTGIEGETLQAAIVSETERPFDLENGPLIRARLFRLGPQDNILVITTHHILTDGWSYGVLQRDQWKAYEAALAGESLSSALPALALQYGDFAVWQNEWLGSEEARQKLEFWQRRLIPAPPVLNFTPAQWTLDEALEVFSEKGAAVLPADLVQSLKNLSARSHTTFFTVTLTAFGVLLNRLSGSEDFVISSPVANRTVETEELIGPFASLVCLRLNFQGNPTLSEAVERVRDTTVDYLSHANLPFETLLEAIPVQPQNGRNPLAQVSFFYQNAFLRAREAANLTIEPLPEANARTLFELQFGLVDRPEGVYLRVHCDQRLFSPQSINFLAGAYLSILKTMVENPQCRLSGVGVNAAATSANPKVPDKAAPAGTLQGPMSPMATKVLEIWRDTLRLDSMSPDDDYFRCGGNSLLAVRLFSRIEKECGIRLPLAALIRCSTPRQFAAELERGKKPGLCLVEIERRGSRPIFFCVHGAGGNVLLYRELAARLGPDQPFYGLQSKGLVGNEAPLEKIEDMAAAYIQEVRELQPKGPYCLGGYCGGGNIALEMALQLQAQGEQVDFLALFDTINWSSLPPLTRSWKLIYHIQRIWFHLLSALMLEHPERVAFLKAKWTELKSRAKLFGPAASGAKPRGAEVGSESREALIWKLNDEAILRYVPGRYEGTIHDFRPKSNYWRYRQAKTGWNDLASRHEVIELPVMPASMLMEPFVKHLAEEFRLRMDRVAAGRDAAPGKLFLSSPKSSRPESVLRSGANDEKEDGDS